MGAGKNSFRPMGYDRKVKHFIKTYWLKRNVKVFFFFLGGWGGGKGPVASR